MDELKKFFVIANRLRGGQDVTTQDIQFYLEYAPKVDDSKMKKLIDGGEFASFEDAQAAVQQASIALQSSPQYKEKTLEIARQAEAGKISQNLADGINLVLAGTDIANSIAQIRASDSASRRSRRPTRPAVPQRDVLLSQALRQAEMGTMDSERAIAPVRAEIQDQYLGDLQNAKTASTGQAGAYGSYAQLAANRRNRAALNLAPIQDEIRRGQESRYDNLLGMRMKETQNQFENEASLYPNDLYQYGLDQQTAASLGATGRENLRGSLYNLGGQAANFIGNQYTRNKYNRLRNSMSMYGDSVANTAVKAEQNLNNYLGFDDSPNYWEQLY